MNILDYTELGGIILIFLFAIKEFFMYLRVKKTNGTNNDLLNREILNELKIQNTNHLTHLTEKVENGFLDLIKSSNDNMNMLASKMDRMIESLGEIKGRLK